MAEFVTKAQGNLNTVLGAVGTAGALGMNGGGILGNLFGGGNYMCNENMPVNRYEAQKDARISELETEIKLRDANFYTLGEMGKIRDYVDNRFEKVEAQLCEQKVFNATAISNISCIQGQIAQLMGLTKLVVPNSSICPGWGDVTVSVTPATAAAGA